MSKENLMSKNCKELRELAKEFNVVGRWDMKKDELVDAILSSQVDTEVGEENNKVVDDSNKKSDKSSYINNVDVGTIVAFKLSNGKVKSAKISKKSTKRKMLKLITEYGAEFIVSYDSVIWVKTGKRWPKGVYNMLKGLGDSVEQK